MSAVVDPDLVSVDIDQAKAWEYYQILGGDTAAVAAALGEHVRERDVVLVAQRFDWPDRLRAALASSGSVTALNRARNGAQALRLLRVLDGVLDSIEKGGPAAITEWTTVTMKDVPNRTGGPLMQLASAMDVAQKLTYKALGDAGESAEKGKVGAERSLMTEMTRALEESAKALGEPPAETARRIVSPTNTPT